MVVEVVLQNVGSVDPITAVAGTVMMRVASACGGTNSVASSITLQAATVLKILVRIILISHEGGRCRRMVTGSASASLHTCCCRSWAVLVRALIIDHDRVIGRIVIVRHALLVV